MNLNPFAAIGRRLRRRRDAKKVFTLSDVAPEYLLLSLGAVTPNELRAGKGLESLYGEPSVPGVPIEGSLVRIAYQFSSGSPASGAREYVGVYRHLKVWPVPPGPSESALVGRMFLTRWGNQNIVAWGYEGTDEQEPTIEWVSQEWVSSIVTEELAKIVAPLVLCNLETWASEVIGAVTSAADALRRIGVLPGVEAA